MHSTHLTERPNWLLTLACGLVLFAILRLTH
jgi:hypothetical protein